ncbi:MAG TPA: hypothetical protein VMB79_14640 [Jatrophihabitans sp.]|nr:hypothetical protein [Jatrophihabitans sp.]
MMLRTRTARTWLAVAAVTGLACAGALVPGVAWAGTPLSTPNDTTSNTDGIADPGVLRDPATSQFVSLSTGGSGRVWTAADAGGPWTKVRSNALSSWPSWADSSQAVWAPSEIELNSGSHSGQYVMFFSAVRSTGPSPKRCIGVAIGDSATGPFAPERDSPLVCPGGSLVADPVPEAPDSSEGVIDPTPRYLWHDGTQGLYLTYKTTGIPSSIQLVRLNIDSGASDILGSSHELIQDNGNNQENPILVQRGGSAGSDGTFTLFTSKGNYHSCDNYATYWRNSASLWNWGNVAGTELRFPSGAVTCGQGDADIVPGLPANSWRIFFSAHWEPGKTYEQAVAANGGSSSPWPFHLYVGALVWNGDTPSVSNLVASGG